MYGLESNLLRDGLAQGWPTFQFADALSIYHRRTKTRCFRKTDSTRTLRSSQTFHPGGERLLIGSAGAVCGVYGASVSFGTVLADFEFSFDAGNRNAEAHDAGKHGAAESLRKITPPVGVSGIVGLDEAGQEC